MSPKNETRAILEGILSAEYLALVAARRAARLAGNIKAKEVCKHV